MSWDEIVDLSKNDKRFIAACHAMQAIIPITEQLQQDCAEICAKVVVQYADALIAELEKK